MLSGFTDILAHSTPLHIQLPDLPDYMIPDRLFATEPDTL